MAEKKKTSRYSPEFRERAVRLLDEHRSDYPSLSAACREIGGKLGCSGDSLHDWWKQARRDAGAQPGRTTAETARIKALEREVRELRQANEILKKASAYFAQAELDRLCGRPFKGNASHCLSHAISKTYYSTGG
ncbi:transposase [Acetobacter cerevisiae]|uniref:Transposase n=1 Tax=Acetobacter cerevisiae TaxID=178900 RepID=A0A149QPB5_9PROT|nr:transposase [Acetobacter cerevisiae]